MNTMNRFRASLGIVPEFTLIMALTVALASTLIASAARAEDDWTSTSQPSDSQTAHSPTGNTAPAAGSSSASSATITNTQPFPSVAIQYYRYFIQIGDRYMSLPSFNPKYPSSTGITSDQASENYARKVTSHVGNLSVPKTYPLSAEEADAVARPIPSLEVGAYGYIDSCMVYKVLSPSEALVRDIQLIDPDPIKALADEAKKTRNVRSNSELISGFPSSDSSSNPGLEAIKYRQKLVDRQGDAKFHGVIKLVGFNTAAMAEGSRWYGPKAVEGKHDGIWIAIVRSEPVDSTRKTQKVKVLVAVPTEKFNQPLNLDQFKAMLSKLSITEQQFGDMVLKEFKTDSDSARANVFRALESAQVALENPGDPTPADPKSDSHSKSKTSRTKSVFGGE